MKRLFIIFFIGISSISFSQFVDDFNKSQSKREKDQEKSPFGKNRRDAIWSHSQSQHRGFGWFVNPGLTYMLGNSADVIIWKAELKFFLKNHKKSFTILMQD
jgi:hypothetical protein